MKLQTKSGERLYAICVGTWDIARFHDATFARGPLAWLIQMGALPIPKSTAKSHIDEDFGAINLRLTDAEMLGLEML